MARASNARKLRAVPGPKKNVYPYVACRGPVRHRWDAVGPIPGRRRTATFGVQVTFRCENCGTLRFDTYSRLTGDLLRRNYDHPDDYKTDAMPMTHWRTEWMDSIDNGLMVDLDEQ